MELLDGAFHAGSFGMVPAEVVDDRQAYDRRRGLVIVASIIIVYGPKRPSSNMYRAMDDY